MILQKVKEIVADQLGIDDVESITATTSLVKDLEADSLDAVEIIMAIEDEFSVEIPDEEAEGFKNIGDITEYVKAKK